MSDTKGTRVSVHKESILEIVGVKDRKTKPKKDKNSSFIFSEGEVGIPPTSFIVARDLVVSFGVTTPVYL